MRDTALEHVEQAVDPGHRREPEAFEDRSGHLACMGDEHRSAALGRVAAAGKVSHLAKHRKLPDAIQFGKRIVDEPGHHELAGRCNGLGDRAAMPARANDQESFPCLSGCHTHPLHVVC